MSQELPRCNPFIHSGQDIQCPIAKPHRTQNILRKNQNGFQRNRSTTSQILIICRILECLRANKHIICQLTQAFDSIHRGNVEQISLAFGPPKETVAAIMMLIRNAKWFECRSWLSFDSSFILFYKSHSYRRAAIVPRSN